MDFRGVAPCLHHQDSLPHKLPGLTLTSRRLTQHPVWPTLPLEGGHQHLLQRHEETTGLQLDHWDCSPSLIGHFNPNHFSSSSSSCFFSIHLFLLRPPLFPPSSSSPHFSSGFTSSSYSTSSLAPHPYHPPQSPPVNYSPHISAPCVSFSLI